MSHSSNLQVFHEALTLAHISHRSHQRLQQAQSSDAFPKCVQRIWNSHGKAAICHWNRQTRTLYQISNLTTQEVQGIPCTQELLANSSAIPQTRCRPLRRLQSVGFRKPEKQHRHQQMAHGFYHACKTPLDAVCGLNYSGLHECHNIA